MVETANFQVTSDITGESYQVEFCWLQTAISLRHSDTVDVKFLINGAGKIIALPHAALGQACRQAGVPLTDAWCIRIAARHLREALQSGADAEKDLLTLTPARVEALVQAEGQPGRS